MARAIAAIDQPSIIEAGAATSCDRGRATLRQTLAVAPLRPASLLLLLHLTPLGRKCSAYEVSQSTGGRGNR